jgi:hypothetical protein
LVTASIWSAIALADASACLCVAFLTALTEEGVANSADRFSEQAGDESLNLVDYPADQVLSECRRGELLEETRCRFFESHLEVAQGSVNAFETSEGCFVFLVQFDDALHVLLFGRGELAHAWYQRHGGLGDEIQPAGGVDVVAVLVLNIGRYRHLGAPLTLSGQTGPFFFGR